MSRINFIRLSEKRKAQVFIYAGKRKWTLKRLYKHFRQPIWCRYPYAIDGGMGCWSLVFNDTKNWHKQKCDTCEYSKYYRR